MCCYCCCVAVAVANVAVFVTADVVGRVILVARLLVAIATDKISVQQDSMATLVRKAAVQCSTAAELLSCQEGH